MTVAIEISVTQARKELAEIIDRARVEHEPVYLVRHGHRIAAVLDVVDYERLVALAEDMSDILAAREARDEMRQTGVTPIPWDDVKADLGLA
jgi:prevent-host-death family protein